MQTLLELLKKSEEFLAKKGISNPRLHAELLFAHALKCRRLDLYLQFERPMSEPEITTLREMLVRRGKREPVQYITGETDFRNLTLKCDSRALIPRPETEELVDCVLARLAPPGTPARVLDLGTGTGAIALSLASERAETSVVAADFSASALDLARENFAKISAGNATPPQVEFVLSDWFSAISGTFDAIVSNPPYLTHAELECAQAEVKNFEPHSALVAENNGLADLEKILRGARERLADGGFVALETGIAHHDSLRALAAQLGFSSAESIADLSGRDRFFFAKK